MMGELGPTNRPVIELGDALFDKYSVECYKTFCLLSSERIFVRCLHEVNKWTHNGEAVYLWNKLLRKNWNKIFELKKIYWEIWDIEEKDES